MSDRLKFKRGSIENARLICVDLCGPIDGEDFDGYGYGSVDVAEILSGAYDAMQERIAELEEAQRWMPVSEKWPDEDTPVIVIGNVGGRQYLTTAMQTFIDDGEEWSGVVWCQLVANYNPSLWDKREYEYDDDYEYTHWLPLPAEPFTQS